MLDRNPEKGRKENPRPSIRERLPKGALPDHDFLESATETAFHSGSHRSPSGRVLMAWSFAATVIDVLVVFSLVCLFLFVSLLVLRSMSEPIALGRETFTRFVVPLFIFLYSSYLILVRVFLGNSIGEWACGLKLGEPRQRFSPGYVRLVLGRFFVVVATGVIVLPLISLLSGIDWAGRLSGVPLIPVSKRSSK